MKAYAITDIGKKRMLNQDYVYRTLDGIGSLKNLFVVADGMGGHKGGGYASRLAVEEILSKIEQDEESSPAQVLVDAIRHANHCVWSAAQEDERLSGMGTTVVAATFDGSTLTVANVGDSRLYIADEKEIRQITQDHSLVEEMVRFGGISREQARRHPDRNIITRAVGVEDDLKVDCFFAPLKQGDKVLLCSDGLTNMLEDEEIKAILNEDSEIEVRALKLVETANDHGGRDNIAVIIMEPFSDEVNQ
ncbi:MAG: Stp1/IreP family PP2C-type Ser/Thr phosphatase [Lachnospiraceae bacterium]|nr:Stp1/IreP family PP2C-type Ser/Thr phosphatase [Lachnospiraceae bacterium]